MRYSPFGLMRYTAFATMRYSPFGLMRYTACAAVRYSPFGLTRYTAFAAMRYSPFGLMRYRCFRNGFQNRQKAILNQTKRGSSGAVKTAPSRRARGEEAGTCSVMLTARSA